MNPELSPRPPAPAEPATQIVITLAQDGQVQVSGPMLNKILCYGLLDVCRDIVRAAKPEQTSAILPVNGVLARHRLDPP